MTEKVKVTQEQFDWLEKYKTEQQIDFAIDIQLHRKRPDSPIVDWKLSEVARALYVGYEVEPKFKVGDLVHVSWSNGGASIHKVLKVGVRSIDGDLDGIAIDAGGNPKPPLRIVRHATAEEIAHEKERRKWGAVGREVGEFKANDIVYNNGAWEGVYIVYSDNYSADAFGSKLVRVTESGRNLSFHAKDLSIICFAENRQDIERGDE